MHHKAFGLAGQLFPPSTLSVYPVDGGSGPGSSERRRAYRAAMRSHGLEASARVVAVAHTKEAGAQNDRCALGFDDSHLSDYPLIDLTTVHQDAPAIARHAVRLAIEMMEHDDTDGAPPPRDDVLLEPKLVVRGTTGGPRTTPVSQRSTSVVSK